MFHDNRMRNERNVRRRRHWLWVSLAAAALVAITGAPIRAIDRRPLPPFSFVTLDGTETETAQIVRTGRWLLVYVRTDCRPCDDLLRMIRRDDEAIADRLVVVVGGANRASLAAVKTTFPELAGAAWFGDSKRELPTALKLPGAPVVIGLNDRMVVWSRAGALKTSAETLALLQSWVRQ